jgi:RNA polymerase sigma-70 factor (ECF subfamily)
MTSAATSRDATLEAQVSAALARCAAGERAALRVIYDLEAARMIGVALRIVRRRDLAEEAVHDAFERIWRGAGGFDPVRGAARTWVYAIVRNRALTILRDERRLMPSQAEPDGVQDGPERALARLPEESALRRCLDQLDAERRTAVVLAYVYGLTHSELAGRLGVPLGTAKSWTRRSLMALQECMG